MRIEPDLGVALRFVEDSPIPGRVLLSAITGSHHYGFPSPDSDLDIKAIHLAPTDSVLGFGIPREAFDRLEMFEGVECDLTSNEAGQALRMLLRGNGNMLERIMCPYQLFEGEVLTALRELATGALSRRFHGHYAGYLRGRCSDFAGAEHPTAKQALYAYRVALTGAHLLKTGELEADLSVLAEPYGFTEALPLIEKKRATAERVALDADEIAVHRASFVRLARLLDEAMASSPLPEEAANRSACEAWLVARRKTSFAE